MPDGDVISKSVHHRWRSTLARLRGGATPEELASHVNRALAETLRASGGVGGLGAYGAVLEGRARGELASAEARARARAVALTEEPTPFALVVGRAVERCMTAPLSGEAHLQPGVITIAEAVCSEVIDSEFFERVRPVLVGKRFPDHEALDHFIEECRIRLAPQINHLSASLCQDPSAAGLRALPTRRRTRRPSTANLLNQSIL